MLNPFRFIEFNAKVYPAKIALEDGQNAIAYRAFHRLVKQVAAKLRKAGIRPGNLVVTTLPTGIGWIVTNALFHEACIGCANDSGEALDPALEVDWVLTHARQAHFPEERQIVIDQAWLADLGDYPAAERTAEYADENAVARLLLTSGTTGHPKAIAFTLKMLDSRLRTTPSYWSVARGELNLMGLSTVGGIMTALHAAFTGDTYFAPSPGGNIHTLQKYRIRSLVGAPVQLARLLENLQMSGQAVPSVREIRSAGGPLSPALIAGLRQRFTAEIFNVYGATEVGGAAFCAVDHHYDAAVAGYLLEGAVVEIVDDAGTPVPAGVEGNVRIRTPFMAHDYYRNPAASAAVFRDDWFYPGDRGQLMPDGLLRLAGRNSELINRGGVKIDPAAVDQFLAGYAGIRDAAAFGLEDARGVQEVAVAVVAAAGFDMEALRATLLQEFGRERAPRFFFAVEGIPRNRMGKAMRAELSRQFAGAANTAG